MIIECQTCHARFRLDESRIKGRGARVKCRKCGDSIVALKEDASAPPAPGGDGFFDLGSAVRDSAGESRGAPPPVGNLIPFPAPARPVETGAKEPSFQAPTAAEPGMDAVDREAPPGPELRPELRPELDLGPLTLDLRPEERLDLPPASEQEPSFGESPAIEPSAEFRGDEGFLVSDSETLDFLQEKDRGTGSVAPPGVGDISLEISPAPVNEENSFLRKPDAPPPTPGDLESPVPPVDLESPFSPVDLESPFSPVDLESPSAPVDLPPPPLPGDSVSPTSEEISLEGNDTPPAAPAMEIPPYREAEPAPAPPVESTARRGSPEPKPPRPRSSAGPAAAVVLAVLLAAGGYLGLTTSGRKTLDGAIPGVAALWSGKPAASAAPTYDLRNVIGYYESGSASPRILVIKGQVANLSKVEKSGIRISATLLDKSDAVLAQRAVYAGNMLSAEAIRKGDRDTLSNALGNRLGEGLANMNIAPGKSIPFMVIFFDAPATMDSYKLEAKDSE